MILDCIHFLATINVESILEREKWRKEWLKEELDKKSEKDKEEDKDKGEDHLESATDQKPGGLRSDESIDFATGNCHQIWLYMILKRNESNSAVLEGPSELYTE